MNSHEQFELASPVTLLALAVSALGASCAAASRSVTSEVPGSRDLEATTSFASPLAGSRQDADDPTSPPAEQDDVPTSTQPASLETGGRDRPQNSPRAHVNETIGGDRGGGGDNLVVG